MNGEEVHEKMKCRDEILRADKILQFKGLSMSKAREIHGPSLEQEGVKNKQEGVILRNAHFSRRGVCYVLCFSRG